MSLFPAYGSNDETTKSETVSKPCELAWLTNQSFIPFTLNNEPEEEQQDTVDATVETPSHRDDKTHHHASKESKKRKRKEKKKHKKKSSKRRHRDSSSSSGSSSSTSESEQAGATVQPPVRISETDYYTDVDALRIYLTVEKLHRPACPRYRLSITKPLGSAAGNHRRTLDERYKRYYRVHRKKPGNHDGGTERPQSEISEQEERMERSLRTEETPDKWIELIRFRQAHPLPNLDSYQNHKRELAMIERARHRLPGDKVLLDLYLEAIVRVHPTDEVLELVRRAIAKDETNVQLWRALIRNKQCSMAQCIVPDVLRLYESSTRALFMARRSDETMLQLFKNCATFCRQAGLCEQMFGMVQLTLSMNVSGRFGGGGSGSLFGSPEHYHQLLDYEEVILRSGLPMNEIWLRIETLRTAFHYLPFGGGQQLLSDPQRIMLNEDVVGFIYPLINKSYSFELTLIVLRLMKYPFVNARHFEAADCFQVEPFEMDYPEQLLPMLLDVSRNRTYDRELHRFIKGLQVSPSYLNTNLAHEQYLEMVQQFLTRSIDHFESEQSALLLVLYLQLERTLVCWEKASATAVSFDEQKAKLIRGRVKTLLKHTHSSNQNNLFVYAEYGLLEYELTGLEGGTAACRKIFDTSVQVHCANAEQSTLEEKDEQEHAFCSLVLTMVELLLLNGHTSEAVHALTKLVLNPSEVTFRCASEQEPPPPSNTSKLSALQKLNDRVNSAVRNETNLGSTAPTVEQYFRPAPLITSLKAYVFYLTLIRVEGFKEAVRQLETLLFLFNEPTNPRHRFLREQIYELYLQLCNSRVSGWKVSTERPGSGESTRQLLDIVDRTLQDFPSNLYALRSVVFNESVPWFRLRRLLGKHLSPKAVLLMVIGARFRANADNAVTAGETDPYKQRILNLLADAVKSPNILALHQNALLWRLYLRELFDQPNARPGYSVLEHCRRTLYAALEACPWNKALYLDGASVAPQELSALLDLMMEKQLRVHAIPEELAILRNE
ncbi:nuclear exosome regulator NRDE2 [Anopheles aquasalis]|uniref:nuclear exosome regulator NRDE2 n=1 Tax=Anopheles aquasalis TaxID=42839 RepID=UPI00215B528D|nr:nuclear exosome regulator NRDE2 [Anopheles aquasalis]